MKQIIKNWIISKLGGIPATQRIDPFIIQQEQRDVIKVQVERAIPKFQIELMSPEEEVVTVKRCLANLLGGYLIEGGYMTVSVEEEADRKVFYASLKIVKGGEADETC